MSIRKREEPIFNNKRRAYVFTDDDGQSYALTCGWQEGQRPKGEPMKATIFGLALEDALARANAWVDGAKLAQVRFGEGIAV